MFQKTAFTLEQRKDAEKIKSILHSLFTFADAGAAVRRNLWLERNELHFNQKTYPLNKVRNIIVVGAGKAAYSMAEAVLDILKENQPKGLVIVKEGFAKSSKIGDVEICEASHPTPDHRGIDATRRMLQYLNNCGEDDLVLVLLSGGASALLTQPYDTISLDDYQTMTSKLLSCGATIHEINTIRKHCDLVKGGRLAKAIYPAQSIVLIVSDVVGDDVDVIASSPMTADTSTYRDAIDVVERYRLVSVIPDSICNTLLDGLKGLIPETPKIEDGIFKNVNYKIIASNVQVSKLLKKEIESKGYNTMCLTNFLQGEASQVAYFFSALARQIVFYDEPLAKPACLFAGGETTVTLIGQGRGGRNHELACAAVPLLAGLPQVLLISLASDGDDGNSKAAGAAVSGESYARAAGLKISAVDYLRKNDSASFFELLGDQFVTGATSTNVNDFLFLFVT